MLRRSFPLLIATACVRHGPPNQCGTPECGSFASRLRDNGVDRAEFPLEHRLDFDGDGLSDHVYIDEEHGTVRLLAASAKSPYHAVSPLNRTAYGEPAASVDPAPDFGWIVAWRVAAPSGAGFEVPGLGVPRVTAPDALGEALWMSGPDAAALLYRSREGWVLVELGY